LEVVVAAVVIVMILSPTNIPLFQKKAMMYQDSWIYKLLQVVQSAHYQLVVFVVVQAEVNLIGLVVLDWIMIFLETEH